MNNDMPVKKRGSNYQIDIYIGEGKRYRKQFKGTVEEAVIYERELTKRFKKPSGGHITVADLVEPYLQWSSIHQSPKTYKDKKRVLFAHLLLFFGNINPDLITPALLDSYKKKRIEERGQ